MTFKKTLLFTALTSLTTLSFAEIEVLGFNSQIELNGLDSQQKFELDIQTPEGLNHKFKVNNLDVFLVKANEIGMSQLNDGQYKYQLTPVVSLKKRVVETEVNKESINSTNHQVLSGVFTIKDGQTVIDQDEENQLFDQQIIDDLIVMGSQCVGVDCVNGESFGFDTIRLKENNLRIKFQDTSNSAGFPSNDWQITANDSANGGANRFSIDDVDGGRTPFTIEAGARSHALYVDNSGHVGFGTSTPVVDNHIVSGNTPTVRLDQNGSEGWPPQIWDMGGNEISFFIRDITHSNRLPFRVATNSPDKSLFIQPDGIEFFNNTSALRANNRLGIGTTNPSNNIHVKELTGNAGIVLDNVSSNESWKFVNKGSFFEVSKSGTGGSEFRVTDAGELEIRSGTNTPNFDMDANGNVVIQGALTQNSDVNTKENIQSVNTSEILAKVMNLPISVWNYKFDDAAVKHLGPMAQDFFEQFNLGHSETKIATIDTSGVALASIKELGLQLQKKESEIKSLQQENSSLKSRLDAIEEKLKHLSVE
jgi:hypothetical protein